MSFISNLILIAACVYITLKVSPLIGLLCFVGLIAYILIKSYPAYMCARANAEYLKKNYQKAFRMYEKAYKSKNRKFTVDLAYSQALLRYGLPEKALEVLDKILYLRLTNEIKFPAKQTRSLIYYKLGRTQEAYEEAQELFDDGYTTSNMYCLVGLMMLANNEPIDKTLAFCEKAYDYDNENRDIIDNLLVCYIKTNNLEKAIELSDIIIENHPTFVEAWYHAAQVNYMLGDNKKAAEYLGNIKNCERSFLTTVSEEDIEKFKLKVR